MGGSKMERGFGKGLQRALRGGCESVVVENDKLVLSW